MTRTRCARARGRFAMLLIAAMQAGPPTAWAQTTNLEELQKKLDEAKKAQQQQQQPQPQPQPPQKKLDGARKAPETKKAPSPAASPAASAARAPASAPDPSSSPPAAASHEAAPRPASAPASTPTAAERAASSVAPPPERPAAAASSAEKTPSSKATAFVLQGDGVLRNTVTGLLWSQSDNAHDIDWAAAQQHCARLPGWRLPSVAELQSLYDPQLPAQPCGTARCKVSDQLRLTSRYFWTNDAFTTTALFQSQASSVSLADGRRYVVAVGHSVPDRALCVRQP